MPPGETSRLTDFAVRLLAYEATLGKSTADRAPGNFRIFQKMCEPLAKLMGISGYRAILGRAIAISGEEIPWLRALSIDSKGCLTGFPELDGKVSAEQRKAGELLMAAKFLGLLTNFIGPALTQELLQEAWPKFKELEF